MVPLARLAIACLWLLLLGLAVPTPAARAEAVRVALEENGFPPFYFKPGEGKDGIYQKLLAAVARVSGDTYQTVYLPQNRKLRAFVEGEIDVEPGVNPAWREKWAAISLYSLPFGTSDDVLIKAPSDRRPVAAVADLAGRKVGCLVGFSYPKLEGLFASSKAERDDSPDELTLVRKLEKGWIDVGVIERTVGAYLRKLHPDLAFVLGGVIDSKPVMFRFHARHKAALERFNQGLAKIKSDGTLEKIFAEFR